MKKLKVYIAGPYTRPDPVANTNAACLLWKKLLDLGYIPYCPHWTLIQQAITPIEDTQVWYNYDLEWLAVCDILLRLPGASVGADAEEAYAKEHDIPVVYSLDALRFWTKFGTTRTRTVVTIGSPYLVADTTNTGDCK